MAGIISVAVEPAYYTQKEDKVSPELYPDAPIEYWDKLSGFPTGGSESGVVQLFRIPEATPFGTIQTASAGSFFDDFYNRIHVSPKSVDVGFLTSTQVREIDVWNAYVKPQLLSSIDESDTEGLDIHMGVYPPTYYNALESRILELSISVDGPSFINATFTLNFPQEQPQIKVTGSRVQVWPYLPDRSYTEDLMWLTDVLPSYGSEQRIQLRTTPRQKFTYTHQLDAENYIPLVGLSRLWNDKLFGVPLWQDGTPIFENLPAGATSIYFNTENAEYEDGGLCIAWNSDKKFVTLEIDKVHNDRIVLKRPLADPVESPFTILPLRLSHAETGIMIQRSHNNNLTVKTEFVSYKTKDLAAQVYPVYKGHQVVTDRTATVSSITENIRKDLTYLDNKVSQPHVITTTLLENNRFTLGFVKNTRADLWRLRQFIYGMKGRLKSLWIIDWSNGVIVVNDIQVGVAINIKPINVSTFFAQGFGLAIQLHDGTFIFRTVLSGVPVTNEVEQVVVDEPFEQEIPKSSIRQCHIMWLVRFDSDDVQITHHRVGQATVTIPVKELKDVVLELGTE